MTPEEWTRARALFEQALELPAAERQGYVETRASGDLRRTVLRLLASAEGLEGFLTPPALLPEPALAEAIAPGDRIGSYRIVRWIGAGGMGTVFEALQERPARRWRSRSCAAGSPRARPRGASSSRPKSWDGCSIHRSRRSSRPACTARARARCPTSRWSSSRARATRRATRREQGLGVRARIALFLELCAAVHHGHQKGVIHRDLKPGNVLIDAAGRLKVIDYGVARVAEPGAADAETHWGAFGTLPYMSPEQLRGDPGGIDVPSDVYALGRSCTSCSPAGRRTPWPTVRWRWRSTSWPTRRPRRPRRARRDPARARLDHRQGAREGARAALRHGRRARPGPATLARRRARSVGPATALYRLRKLYRRRRLTVLATAAVLLAILAGLAGTSVGLVRARRAEHVSSQKQTEAEGAAERAQAALVQAERAEQLASQQKAEAEEQAHARRRCATSSATAWPPPIRGGRGATSR